MNYEQAQLASTLLKTYLVDNLEYYLTLKKEVENVEKGSIPLYMLHASVGEVESYLTNARLFIANYEKIGKLAKKIAATYEPNVRRKTIQ